jgi:acyl carrier protein
MDRLFVIQDIFRQVFDDDGLTVTPQTGPGEIADWDSVAQVKLVLSLEETFGIQFADGEISSLQTVGDFLASIEAHQERNA